MVERHLIDDREVASGKGSRAGHRSTGRSSLSGRGSPEFDEEWFWRQWPLEAPQLITPRGVGDARLGVYSDEHGSW